MFYLYVFRPPESEKTAFTKVAVCLSVVGVVVAVFSR